MPPPARPVLSDHNFKASVPGLEMGTFRECTGHSMEFDVFEWAEGGNNEFIHHLPGRLRYPYLRLESGLTEDGAMQKWFWATRQKAELKEITVELQSQDASKTRSWTFADAFPIKWSGPTIAAASAAMSEEVIEIAHSGLKMS